MNLLLFAAVAVCSLAFINAKATPACTVSDWGPFTEWRTPFHDKSVKSFPSRRLEGFDKGAEERAHLMKIKHDRYDPLIKCLAEGTCPERSPRVDEGDYPCFLGYINGNMPCSNVDQESFVPLFTMTQRIPETGNDIWGWTDPTNGDEYAIFGAYWGTAFVRVTDPRNPRPLGFLASHTGGSSWRDIKVVDDHAYIVSESPGHGVQVFDLTQLRGQIFWQEWTETAHYGILGNCHNIIANTDSKFVYAVGCTEGSFGCDGGLHAINVSDPANPTFAGCFGGDGYVHDAQCVMYDGPDLTYTGREICFCYNEDTFTIVDATDKADMTMLSRTGYSNARYTHQGWVTDDFTLVLLDDEQDEQQIDGVQRTYLWDVRDLDNPTLENVYNSGLWTIDHNQYIVGNLTYQANYESGLRILRIDQDNFQLTEVGYIDVYPDSTTDNFQGAWSVYPYFSSGNIIISSIDYGLYVVKPDFAAMEQVTDSTSERSRYRSILQSDTVNSCPSLVDIERR